MKSECERASKLQLAAGGWEYDEASGGLETGKVSARMIHHLIQIHQLKGLMSKKQGAKPPRQNLKPMMTPTTV